MADIRVDLGALQGFADQLDQRLQALQSTRQVVPTIPLGGAPAWEGQALYEAYTSRVTEAERLLQSLRAEVQSAVDKARDQVRNVRTTDENSAGNSRTNEQALDGSGGQTA